MRAGDEAEEQETSACARFKLGELVNLRKPRPTVVTICLVAKMMPRVLWPNVNTNY